MSDRNKSVKGCWERTKPISKKRYDEIFRKNKAPKAETPKK